MSECMRVVLSQWKFWFVSIP